MKKFALKRRLLLGCLFDILERRPKNSIALANELAGRNDLGVTTVQVDTAQTVPLTNTYIGTGKNLIWQIGTNSTATLRTGMVCAGGQVAATKANYPLGISPDAPYQAGDWVPIQIFGITPGSLVGISAGAITDLDWVGPGANGLVQSLAVITTQNVWCFGKATKTVTGIGQEVSIAHCEPFIMNVNTGTPNTYAIGTPL